MLRITIHVPAQHAGIITIVEMPGDQFQKPCPAHQLTGLQSPSAADGTLVSADAWPGLSAGTSSLPDATFQERELSWRGSPQRVDEQVRITGKSTAIRPGTIILLSLPD
ncbi:hypothetical protein VTN02DRAFT_5083 [Thermoascus thermophilus]